MDRRNVAARAAHWSANHRKTAIWGWLAFVVVAVMLGNSVGQNQIHGADQFSGEAGRAEHALEDAGLRPNDEAVLIQSRTLTIEDPEFRATVDDAAERLSRTKDVKNVVSPLGGPGETSADGHTALVEFEITGDSLEAAKRLEPAEEAVDAVKREHPDLRIEQFGSVSSNKQLQETFTSDLLKAELLSFPITLLILIIAFGSVVAALVPLLLGFTCVMAAISLVALPSQLSPVDSNISSVILLIGLAVGVDYSLFYLRREREERAAGRDERSALEVAAATSGRAVLISGLTVIAAMSGMFLTGDKTFISFSQGTILVVAIAMFASLTVLPALLAWLGDRIEKGRIPFLSRRRQCGRIALLVGDGGSRDATALAGDRHRRWRDAGFGGSGPEHAGRGHERGRPAAGPGRDQDLRPAARCLSRRGGYDGRGRRGQRRPRRRRGRRHH